MEAYKIMHDSVTFSDARYIVTYGFTSKTNDYFIKLRKYNDVTDEYVTILISYDEQEAKREIKRVLRDDVLTRKFIIDESGQSMEIIITNDNVIYAKYSYLNVFYRITKEHAYKLFY